MAFHVIDPREETWLTRPHAGWPPEDEHAELLDSAV